MYSFALVLLHPVQYPLLSIRLAPYISPDIALLGASETQLTFLVKLLRQITNQQISSSVPAAP